MAGIKKIRMERDLQYYINRRGELLERHERDVENHNRALNIYNRSEEASKNAHKGLFGHLRKYSPKDPPTPPTYYELPSPQEMYQEHLRKMDTSDEEPIRYYNDSNNLSIWMFKREFYKVSKSLVKSYNEDEIKLLILDHYDKERRRFERLKNKFVTSNEEGEELKRPRIPEDIRIKVWQRDEGKCARCGSREKLEYDHIVPISKGGSNTLRNIELLCEGCNRSKSNTIGG